FSNLSAPRCSYVLFLHDALPILGGAGVAIFTRGIDRRADIVEGVAERTEGVKPGHDPCPSSVGDQRSRKSAKMAIGRVMLSLRSMARAVSCSLVAEPKR